MPSETPFWGPDRGCGAIDKLQQFHLDTNKADKEVISWFYSALTILDAKANGLMRVNSSFITILLFYLGAAQAKVGTEANEKLLEITPGQMLAAGIALILLLVSTFLCFLIVRVSWKFLSHVKMAGDGVYDFKSEAGRLANVIDDRTHYYLIGWYLTLIAAAIPIIMWIQTGMANLQ